MAEQLVRLYGPAQVLGTIASPTTLFTVPPKETYLVRALHVLSQPVTGTSGTTIGSVVVGKTNLSTGNLMFGVDVISQGAVYPSNIETVSLPFTENEVMAGGAAGIPTALSNYWDGTAAVEFTGTVDATSFATSSMTAAATVPFPANVYMWMVNNKTEHAPIADRELARRGSVKPTVDVSGHALDRASLLCRVRDGGDEPAGDALDGVLRDGHVSSLRRA